jgi:signal peptidase I
MNYNSKKKWKSWGKSLFIALGVAFVARTFLFAPYIVEGASMEPTLHNNEKIFVNKFNLTDRFKRGEIVIIKEKKKTMLKE